MPNEITTCLKTSKLKGKKKYFLIFALLLSARAQSQDSARFGSWITADIHYGYIMPVYSNSMLYLIRAHVPAMEFDYLYKPSGTQAWQTNYHLPETGVALFCAWLGNPGELGNMIGVYPFVNFHLQQSYTEALYLRFGIGLGYLPVIYNRLTNYKNDVIGAHLNAMINLRLTTHFYLSNKVRLEAGLGITHCSDGNFTTPNLGINLLTLNTGVSYCFNPHKVATRKASDTSRNPKSENEILAAAGISQNEPPGGHYYGAVTLTFDRYYALGKKSKLGGGVDVFNNYANISKLQSENIYLNSPLENTQLGIKAAYELTLGRLALPMEMGYYMVTKYQTPGNLYNRFGLRYYFGKHAIANLTLLTHFASAVYIEWGGGYRF